MNFYPFHVGDYTLRTAHLDPMEDLAYRRLLDLYYVNETAIAGDAASIARLIRMRSSAAEVAVVLGEFFEETPEGWRHSHCDDVIAQYQEAKKNHWGNRLTKPQRCAIQAARNAAKLSATPSWLTNEQREDIASVYTAAAIETAKTGIPHEVDHIIPLRGKTVCGLHVAWNLRVIQAHKNRQKSNSLEVL